MNNKFQHSKIKTTTVLTLGFFLVLMSACSKITESSLNKSKTIHLVDGSTVLLNKNSSITYDESFKDRHVELDGEAYFVVKKDAVPFVVSTKLGDIKVIGTEFNVKTSDTQMEVEVEKGSVEMSINEQVQKLIRGESAVFDKSEQLFEKGKAEFKHRIWTKDFQDDLNVVGNEAKKSGREIGKEFKKLGRKIKDEIDD
ncbi:FecR family protein [Carboxylicivirga sp. N1Y90]|uniref:FecR family protein n=1 Tax=Carboxylicivirga fragile TaxID=3417571 RepID=UPI003D3287B7|nr:FecR domain-containing protein [Marinilabiliaceae bacterium N1Y90]